MAAEALEIDVAALVARRQAGRPRGAGPWEVALAPFPGTLAVPMRELPGRVAERPGEVPLVVLGHHGSRSLRVTYWLRAQGLAGAVTLRGGIDAWSSRIDATVPVY